MFYNQCYTTDIDRHTLIFVGAEATVGIIVVVAVLLLLVVALLVVVVCLYR